MIITEKQICDLKAYPNNAKKHDQKQISNVANSIKRFGWRQPIVINRDGEIIIGHCRYLAAKQLGLERVPCTVADDLTESEQRQLRIIDNKTNESPWDYDLLEEEAENLNFDGFDFEFTSLNEQDSAWEGVGSREYGPDNFSDDKFEYECPECGFKFN